MSKLLDLLVIASLTSSPAHYQLGADRIEGIDRFQVLGGGNVRSTRRV